MNDKPIDVPAEVTQQALVVREQAGAVAPSNLFGASDAVAVVQKATAIATALREVIAKQGLISKIQGKSYPKCEAWTLLGTMLGVYPVLQWSKQLPNGWEARVEARTRDGAVVGAAEAECLKSERNWANRDDFALRSMAQTRATAKALRMPLGFVMTLSGYEPTPAEEMVADHPQPLQQSRPLKHTAPSPAASPTPQSATPVANGTKYATQKHLARLVEALAPQRELAERFFKAIDWLLPTESLEKLELAYVPISKEQFDVLSERLAACENGEPATAPYPPNPRPLDAPKATPQTYLLCQIGAKPEPKAPQSKPIEADPEWWRKIIVPIPHKYQKRDDYIKNPETVGGLYDLRHGTDDLAQEARQRLWGFINHYEAKPWIGKDGKERPPSASDVRFREALDACAEWHKNNHPDEKL